MAKVFHVTLGDLKLRLKRAKRHVARQGQRNWHDKELVFLERHYPGNRNAELARALKRTEYSVEHKARELGVAKV